MFTHDGGGVVDGGVIVRGQKEGIIRAKLSAL